MNSLAFIAMESIDALIVAAEQLVADDLNAILPITTQPHSCSSSPQLPCHHSVLDPEPLDRFMSDLLDDIPTTNDATTIDTVLRIAPNGSPCAHSDCSIPDYANVWQSFSNMNVSQRVCIVRNMLFATTAPKGKPNNLCAGTAAVRKTNKRKRKRDGSVVKQRSTVVYSVRGAKLCRTAFSHLVSLEEKTLERHANKVANGDGLVVDISKKSESRKGKHGRQRLVAAGFFLSYGADNGLECPSGRGSQDDKPLLLLPSSTTKADVHDSHKKIWETLVDAVIELTTTALKPTGPLSYSLFQRYWEIDFPTLRIAKSGSNFCDLCTALKDDLVRLDASDPRRIYSSRFLEEHRQDAKEEFMFYRNCQSNASSNPNGNKIHLVFDFAEKVLLPKLQKQPGQLHFITGLKFDIFGISSSNEGTNYVFGLPEGHWPNEKTANTVLSMLHHILERQSLSGGPGSNARHLQLHADNCAGQNKNRFVLWYLCWRVMMGLDDECELLFLVTGHTKNVCDAAFGHIKRHLKKIYARTLCDMMQIVKESSSTTRCIPSAEVHWFLWKTYLSTLFRIPARFQITKYHVFSTKRCASGILFARSLTRETDCVSFNILQEGISEMTVQESWALAVSNELLTSEIVNLDHVSSAQHDTRKKYLAINILDRYYANDAVLRQEFFADGTNMQ